MAPAAVDPPPQSALERLLKSSIDPASDHPAHLQHLANAILHNLQYQHDWTSLTIHNLSSTTQKLLPRPLISGVPPSRAYVHPDEQVEILKAEHAKGEKIKILPEREWVLPTHIKESFSLARFAEVFDAIDAVPRIEGGIEEVVNDKKDDVSVGAQWRGNSRQKRLLLATLHDDSTVVYYIMHNGIVKPRQN